MTLRIDRFFNYVYSWCIERVQDRAELDAMLALPLPGSTSPGRVPSRAELETEGSDFMAFMGQMTTG
jgi:hypothetical protein